MPYHSLPGSRRAFLGGTLAGSLGLLVLPWARAAAAEGEGTRWALLSDPHVAADPLAEKNGINMTERLRSAVAQVQQLSPPPAGLILNGDCAFDLGLPEDYANFTGLMQPLAARQVPLHYTLGNHDQRENFWSALQESAALPRPVAGKQISIVETPEANWFLLDSLLITKQTPGRLGEEQRAWLAQALDARAGRPALVMVHHNPIPPDGGATAALLDADEFLALLIPRRHVKAVFFGHTHTWRLSERGGLHLVNLPAVGYPFDLSEVTGWVDCHLASDRMTLQLRAHDTAAPEHGRTRELVWRS